MIVELYAATLLEFAASEPARWAGVDETVVGRVAAEAGRHSRPFLDPSGDLLLFLFLCAGIVGGFVAGYLYRRIFVEEARRAPEENP